MGPDESDVGDGGVRERYGGLGWETFDVTDNIDIDGDLFGRLLDMDYDDALDPDKELMATNSPSNFAMPWERTPELSVTPLPNALGSAGKERGRDSGANNGTSGTSWHQALEEASLPSSGSVGLESSKVSLKPSPVNRAFSAPNAEDGPFGGVTKSQASQDQSGARQLGISRKRHAPVGHLSPANEDCPHRPAKFMKNARDKARKNVYGPSSMGAERSGRVTMLSCERQLRSNPITSSMAEQVSNRMMLQKIEARGGAFEDGASCADNRVEQCRPSPTLKQSPKTLISVAVTPSPPSTASCRIPRLPLLGRPGHALSFRSVAAAAAAPKTPCFPPLGGRDLNVMARKDVYRNRAKRGQEIDASSMGACEDEARRADNRVSTTDENAAGECSFIHDMEKLLFTWDPSEVRLEQQQQQQQQKLYRQERRGGLMGLTPGGSTTFQTNGVLCGNPVNVGSAVGRKNRNGLNRPARSPLKGRPGHTLPFPPAVAAPAAAKASSTGGRGSSPSWLRARFLPLGGRDPFPAAITGGMAERDQASNIMGQPFQQQQQQWYQQQRYQQQQQQQRYQQQQQQQRYQQQQQQQQQGYQQQQQQQRYHHQQQQQQGYEQQQQQQGYQQRQQQQRCPQQQQQQQGNQQRQQQQRCPQQQQQQQRYQQQQQLQGQPFQQRYQQQQRSVSCYDYVIDPTSVTVSEVEKSRFGHD